MRGDAARRVEGTRDPQWWSDIPTIEVLYGGRSPLFVMCRTGGVGSGLANGLRSSMAIGACGERCGR